MCFSELASAITRSQQTYKSNNENVEVTTQHVIVSNDLFMNMVIV